MCANATAATGVSADGSFLWAQGVVDILQCVGLGFLRLDDSEDGDIDPYVILAPNAVATDNLNKNVNTTVVIQVPFYNTFTTYGLCAWVSTYITPFRGFRRRGLSDESFENFLGLQGMWHAQAFQTTGYSPTLVNPADAERVATAIVPTIVRQSFWVYSPRQGYKMRKGTPRWLFLVHGGGASKLYDNSKWVQVGARVTGYEPCYGCVAGPWEISTIPQLM
jgi:hypothetical protein